MGFRVATARAATIDLSQTSIATEYSGVRFRSRLEAKWAAMFTELRWPWEYEPLDLSGYIPDFIVSLPGRPHLVVEVKPALDFAELEPLAQKICRSGWRGDFLVVGARIFASAGWPSFGLLGLWDREVEDGWQAADHAEVIDCGACERTSFRHASAGYRCHACGSDERMAVAAPPDEEALRRRWGKAANAVQWKGDAEEGW